MTSCELVTFVTSIACILSDSCDTDELSVMAAVFTQLGDTIATILAHRDSCETAVDIEKVPASSETGQK